MRVNDVFPLPLSQPLPNHSFFHCQFVVSFSVSVIFVFFSFFCVLCVFALFAQLFSRFLSLMQINCTICKQHDKSFVSFGIVWGQLETGESVVWRSETWEGLRRD